MKKKILRIRQGGYSHEFFLTFPSYAWLTIFFLIPIIVVFAFAFKAYDVNSLTGGEWSLQTFWETLTYSNLLIFWRTLWLSLATTVICLILALPVGYYIAGASPQMRNIFILLVVVPFWSSFLIRIFAWKSLLHPEGYLKQFLVFLHLMSEDSILLYNAMSVLVVMVYSYLPFAILPIFAAASKFNFQLLEASMDLGATRLEAFFKVFIPGMRSAIMTAMLMVFIPAIGAYVIPDIVGGPQNEMLGNKIAQRVFIDRNLPQASALSVLLAIGVLLPIAMALVINYRWKKSGKQLSTTVRE